MFQLLCALDQCHSVKVCGPLVLTNLILTCTLKTIVTAMQSMIFLWLKIDHGAWSVIVFSLY